MTSIERGTERRSTLTVTASATPFLPSGREQGQVGPWALPLSSHLASEPSTGGSWDGSLLGPVLFLLTLQSPQLGWEEGARQTHCYSSFYNFRAFELNLLALCVLSPWRGQRDPGSAVRAFLGLRWHTKGMAPNHVEDKKVPRAGRLSEAQRASSQPSKVAEPPPATGR